jgi:hypothetical protein
MPFAGYGGGHEGAKVVVLRCVPDATLETAIDAAIAAKTEVTDIHVKFSTGANREVTVVADGDFLGGRIIWYQVSGTSYVLECEMYAFLDQAGVCHPANRIITVKYTVAPSLGNSVLYDDPTIVKAGSTGIGRVININTAETTVDVII